MKILVCLLLFVWSYLFASIEFMSENIDGQAYCLILIPYSDIFHQIDGDSRIIDNYLAVSILNDRNDILHQSEHHISLKYEVNFADNYNNVNLNNEYFPLAIKPDIEAGSYNLSIVLSSPHTGQKRVYRDNFRLSPTEKNYGYAILVASIGEISFTLRSSSFLANNYDKLEIWQPLSFDADSTFIIAEYNNEYDYFSPDDLTLLSGQKIDENLNLQVGNTYKQQTYFSNIVFPTVDYFFILRFTPREQLAQMRNILIQNVYQQLRNTSDEHLQEAIDSYWRSINPDIYSVDNYYQKVFYTRVMYADKNFGVKGYLDGWQTDRGKIYLKYGEPDHISSDRFPIGRDASITWYYYGLNKSFTFYDLRGYGNYELRDKWID